MTRSRNSRKGSWRRGRDPHCPCPRCHKRPRVRLEKRVAASADNGVPACDDCDGPVTEGHWCRICEEWVCGRCGRTHHLDD